MNKEDYVSLQVAKLLKEKRFKQKEEDALKAIQMVRNEKVNYTFGMQGWICPKCGRVYSPFTHMCMYCGGIQEQNIKYSETWSSNNIEINNK